MVDGGVEGGTEVVTGGVEALRCLDLRATALFVAGFGAAGYATRRDLSWVARACFWALLALITFSRINGSLDGQVMAFFVMVVAAAEVVVGLAIIMSIFRTRRSASVDDANLLKY